MKTKRLILTAFLLIFLVNIGLNCYNAVFGDTGQNNTSKERVRKQSLCEKRGGKELPDKVLLMQKCILEGPLLLLDSTKFDSITRVINKPEYKDTLKIKMKIVYGNNCRCVDPPKDYTGKMGCDLTWETFCVR